MYAVEPKAATYLPCYQRDLTETTSYYILLGVWPLPSLSNTTVYHYRYYLQCAIGTIFYSLFAICKSYAMSVNY